MQLNIDNEGIKYLARTILYCVIIHSATVLGVEYMRIPAAKSTAPPQSVLDLLTPSMPSLVIPEQGPTIQKGIWEA